VFRVKKEKRRRRCPALFKGSRLTPCLNPVIQVDLSGSRTEILRTQ
jgi:hypothetical protein